MGFTIEDGVLKKCEALPRYTGVQVPDGVTVIGERAFAYSDHLTSVVLPASVTEIRGGAFWGCEHLRRVYLPDGLRTIGRDAFRLCSSLTEIRFPEGLVTIGVGAFYGSGLTAVRLPERVTELGAHAFSYCESLTDVQLPPRLRTIGEGTFAHCRRLYTITMPERLQMVENGAFFHCERLSAVRFPESVGLIKEDAFSGCTSLTAIELPEEMAMLEALAFSGCKRLITVRLPVRLQSLSRASFYDTPWLIEQQTRLVIREGTLQAVLGDPEEVIVPAGVETIGHHALYGCTRLTAVTLPDGRSIVPADVTGAARPPIVIAYTTDTLPLPRIVDLARDADLFIGEGMYGDLAKRESMDDKHHMLMQDSCRIAMEAGAKRLWLTHYSPAEKGPMAWKEALEAICPFVHISQDGDHIQIK